MKALWTALILVVTPWAAWAGQSPVEDLRLFMEYFEGEFNNFLQVSAEGGSTSGSMVPDELRHPWHHHTVQRVHAPAFGEHVFYSQINERGPDGPVVRRTVDVIEADLDSGTIRQRFFTIEDGDDVAPSDLSGLSPDALRGYPEGCQVVWRRLVDRFVGTIAAGDCEVVSRRSGTPMFIVAEMVLARDAMWHSEGGVDEELLPIFGPPGNVPFKLGRATHHSCQLTHGGGDEPFREHHLHDQGGTAELTISGDQSRAYVLQLVSSTQLELSLRSPEGDEVVAAARTIPNAERIGLEFGSIRVDCTRSTHPHDPG